jgi:signal transduction histidine kinase
VVALLALDRLDYWLFGEVPPIGAGIILLAARFLLVEVVAQYGGVTTAIWLYALLPSIGANYFGPRGAYITGVIIWVAFVARTTLAQLPLGWSNQDVVGSYVSGIVMFSFLLVFVVTMARMLWEEKASRIRAESLLAELQHSHKRLEEYSEQAITATEDRNRIARQIHDTLGHYLAVINVQLEKALAFRDRDPEAAEQAVRDGKHQASEALHDVRRSVGALRSFSTNLQAPEAIEKLSDDQRPTGGNTKSSIRMWLAPRPFDVVTSTMYIGMLILDIGWGESDVVLSWRSLLWGVIAFSLVALDRLDYRLFGEVPPVKAGIVLMALRFLLIVAVGALIGWWYTIWLFPLLIYTGFAYFEIRGGYIVAALTTGGLLLFAIEGAENYGQIDIVTLFSSIFLLFFIMLFMVTTARTALKERMSRVRSEELIAQIEVEHQQLKSYSEQTLDTMQDRNHLAREIHDGLGHYLTVINVQLEKALAFRTIDPEAADQAIRDAKRLTGEALQDVRVTMGSLQPRHETFSLRPAIEQLINNMANSIDVDVHIDGSEDGFSRQSLIALYRATQEGLTNVHKHSRAKEARVRIHLGDREARLYLGDDGSGFDPDTLEGTDGSHDEHYGLQGVRERLQLIGGSIEVLSKVGAGTSLHVTVPREPSNFAHAAIQPVYALPVKA